MKQLTIFILIISNLFFSCKTQTADNKPSTYKGLPLIKANSTLADYRVGNDWIKGNWTISPQIESDSLFISCHSDT